MFVMKHFLKFNYGKIQEYWCCVFLLYLKNVAYNQLRVSWYVTQYDKIKILKKFDKINNKSLGCHKGAIKILLKVYSSLISLKCRYNNNWLCWNVRVCLCLQNDKLRRNARKVNEFHPLLIVYFYIENNTPFWIQNVEFIYS